jgi:hypothetical protein
MADASVLGIHPPSTVRIDLDGWIQDWPWHCVDVYGDELVISVPLTGGRRRVVFYPYEHAEPLYTIPAPYENALAWGRLTGEPTTVPVERKWRFHGREEFTVCAGPVQPAAMDTAGPR